MTNDPYRPERKALHKKILRAMITEKFPANENPKAVFIGGGAASGKSTIRDEIVIPWLGIDPVVIDSDIVKNSLDHTRFPGEDAEAAGIRLHQESKYIAQRAIDLCVIKKTSFIYDSSLAAPAEEYLPLIHLCKSAGYRLTMIGVFTAEDVALAREKERRTKIDREVPERIFHYFHAHFPSTFLSIEKEFDLVRLYDNSFGNRSPVLIAERKDGDLIVCDPDRYRNFLEKAGPQ